MARVDQFPGEEKRYSMDQWPGYEMERRRVMEFLHTRRPKNPVVLTGDIHSNWVNDLTIDTSDPKSPTVATEFVGTSITSGGDGTDLSERVKAVLAENPFVKFQSAQRGYVSCEVTSKRMRADYQVVEYVSRPDAPKITRASFVVESGVPGAQVEAINR
jgi:alkaline phosphatase D